MTGPLLDRTTENFVAAQTKRLTQTAHESGLQGNAGDSSAPGDAVLACIWTPSTWGRIDHPDPSAGDHEYRLAAAS